ncbi:winged helix-turn-helix domain-containing protein [Leptolyngbya ohadii]|uniref:winged helix-turn-helix domain-containing protein n=1 Tax=Leptolyngbya ohadii TaxID=1962290 RepID=UPI000B59DC33|nr:winged helix-turn-helix domain-containing protein [Leptolyngbya ohadii]
MNTPSFPVARAEVFWYIFDKGVSTAEEIARGTLLARSTVQGHLSALEKAGVLEGEGRPKRYKIRSNFPKEYKDKLQELESLARSSWRLMGIEPV